MIASKDRFAEKVAIRPDGCWIWTGATSMLGARKNFPYGNVSYQGKKWQAHRFSYLLYKGAIPKELEIDHLCKVTNCVNPDHLEAVTYTENVRRSSRYHPDGSTCSRGHLMMLGNYKMRPEGFKRCLLCMKEDNARQSARRKSWIK
jgi:hypothetical protein